MDEWELEILRKIDNKEKLDESELSDLVFEYGVYDEKSENMKWSRSVTTICKILDRYFRVQWDNDLSITDDNYFYKQPVEVELKEYQKTITVKEWVDKC